MADFPTYDDLFRIARDEILARNARIRRDIIDREGTDANAIVAAIAGVGDEVVLHLARTCAAQFIDSARDQDLRRLVFDRFGIMIKSASSAVGSVQFSTTADNPAAFTIPVGTKLQTGDGRQYVTTVETTFPEGTTGPVVVAIRSVQAGVTQQARAGTITNLVGTITGAPSDLAVTNPLATAGAADEEEIDSLRSRARAFWSTVQAGTKAAVLEAARATPGVVRASIFEKIDSLGRPAGRAEIVVADQFTDTLVSTANATYDAQSQVLADLVYASIDDVRALGAHVTVTVAQVVLQSLRLALNFDAGFDVDTVALAARAAVVSYVNNLLPGETLTVDGIVDALKSVAGLIVTGDEVSSPTGSVIPELRQVIRTNLSLVTVISTSPSRALQTNTNPDSV